MIDPQIAGTPPTNAPFWPSHKSFIPGLELNTGWTPISWGVGVIVAFESAAYLADVVSKYKI